MKFASLISTVGSALITLVVLTFAADVHAAPLKVRVRGGARLTARASRDLTKATPEVVLTGTLADDAGQPLALQEVTLRVTREADAHDAKTAEGIREARACGTSETGGARRGPTAWGIRIVGATDAPEVHAVTDEEGRFCLRAGLEPDRYKASLVYAPTGKSLIDGVEREITFDLSRPGLELRFEPPPHVVQLDTPRATIEALALLDDDGNPKVAPALGLVLSNEKEELARAITDASGRARFVVPGATLGPPGPGVLRVSYAGDAVKAAGASHAEDIERHVKVGVKVPAADRGELVPGVPEDGLGLVAELASSAGVVAEGSVEARVGDVVVGAAPVERGLARLSLTFTSQGTDALVRLRYVPVSPWYEPLPETAIHVPIRGPSLLSKAPILVAGLAVLAFFLLGRVSGQKYKPDPLPAKPSGERPEPKAGIDVVRPATRGQEGWTGRVTDAHEGHPIAGARVWIERGTFDGRALLASVETDAGGAFTLPGIGPVAGDERIFVEARFHSRLVRELPVPGDIAIAVVQRRRSLLAQLVAWARRKGPPFDARPEPTPGHVRRAATDAGTARWADAIERAAFGSSDVDARLEQDLEEMVPPETPNSR